VRTITFATQKGGSGKSTLAISLAVSAVQDGERVFLLDADPQGTATNWGVRRSDPEPGGDRIASAPQLESALKLLASRGYTLAIIDTPGVESVTTTAAIRSADLVLVPARPTPADIEATKPTIEVIRRLGREYAFVLNQAPTRSFRLSEAAGALNMLGVLALPFIVQRTDHQDAVGAGVGVSEYASEGKAAEEIRALWGWVKRRLKGLNHAFTAAKAAAS
jgi:chromosome partitioning protein